MVLSPSIIQGAFDKGEADARKFKNWYDCLNKFSRGIGSIRTNAIGGKEQVSTIWAVPLQGLAYAAGVMAKKKHFSPDETAQLMNKFRSDRSVGKLIFVGIVKLFPSFGGYAGHVDRKADPGDLSDVRVVLQVGDQEYQPEKQPGALMNASGTGDNEYVDSSTSETETHLPGLGNISSRSIYYTHSSESYDWYEGHFTVVFDGLNPDGSCRITDQDKDITVTVIYGPNERKVSYKLSDFVLVKP